MSMLERVKNRVNMMLGKALLAAVDDAGDIQLVKVAGLAGETQDGIERLQDYGLSSSPPKNSEALVVYLTGNRDHGVVIVCDSGEYRVNQLESGEVVLYSKFGQTILLDKNGDTVFNGGTDYAVAFDDLKSGFDELKNYVNNLVLPVTGAVPSSPPAAPVAGPPTIPSTASIDGSKVPEVRLP